MKRKLKSRKSSPKRPTNQRMFRTVDEFSSYFFPKGHPEREIAKGKERGAKAAENAFGEIVKTLEV